MKNALILAVASLAGLQVTAADIDWSKLPPPATNQNLTFTNDILPMFKASCIRCHGAIRPRAQLRLDSLEGVLKGTEDGPILTAGDSADSQLVKAISRLNPKTAMPPNRRPRPGGPGGPGGPPPFGMQPPGSGPAGGGPVPGGMQPPMGGPEAGGPPPGGPGGTNSPGMPPRNFGPPMKPLTAEQVGIVRAWIDQGAK
jgi:hypothetical protein